MGTTVIILLAASVVASFIAIMSFFMTSPSKTDNSKKSKKSRANRNNKKNKRSHKAKKSKNNFGMAEGDRDVRITKRGSCVYPPEAKKKGIQMIVYIDVHIDDSGKILAFQTPHKTEYGFEEAAYKYIKQWSFKPAILDGQPVDAWVRVPIRFALKKEYR